MARSLIMPAQHAFVKAAAEALRHRCGVPAGARILVAVSGGADSVALLRFLAALAPRRTWRLSLSVAHVQHHLRDARHAETDARFVARLAARLGLPFRRADLDPRAWPRGANVEAQARRERYAALARMARGVHAAFIATAHHADDQLETLLLRLLRGTSVHGLGGIAWRRRLGGGGDGRGVVVIRPLLRLTRADARAFLRDLGQSWREDHTNADTSRLRARLRREVTPRLRALRPDAARRSTALAHHFAQVGCLVQQAVDAAAAGCVRRHGPSLRLSRGDARGLNAVVLTGLLRRLLAARGVSADRLGARQVAPLVRAVRDRTGGRRVFQFHAGARAVVTRASVEIGPVPSVEAPGRPRAGHA